MTPMTKTLFDMGLSSERSHNLTADLEALESGAGYAEAELHKKGTATRAAYKIELNVRPSKRAAHLTTGRIAVVRSGSGTSGEGDVSVFRCSRCKKLIEPEMVGPVWFACPHCRLVEESEKVSEGSVFAFLSRRKLAELTMEFWLAAGRDADIYLKRYKYSIGEATEAFRQGDLKKYETLRRLCKEKPEKVLYPLKNLMRDNLSGVDMIRRFEQFLGA